MDLFFNVYGLYVGHSSATFNFVVLPIFVIEIILNFFTMYRKDVMLVDDIRLIVKRYMKKDFWIDIFPTMPFFVISEYLLMLKMIRLLRCVHYLLQIDNLQELILGRYLNFRKEVVMNV